MRSLPIVLRAQRPEQAASAYGPEMKTGGILATGVTCEVWSREGQMIGAMRRKSSCAISRRASN